MEITILQLYVLIFVISFTSSAMGSMITLLWNCKPTLKAKKVKKVV